MPRDPSLRWIEDDQFFQEQLAEGRRFEQEVVRKLKAAGIEASAMNDGFRESVAEIPKFTRESFDLTVKGHRFEVKSRGKNYPFTGPDDWHFWPMFIDTVASIDNKQPAPLGYIFVSQATLALMAVNCKTKAKWVVERKWDRQRAIMDDFYCARRAEVLNEEQLLQKLRELPAKEVK